jgi:PIN domain nuclease of toxin-antitoxin system
MKYLLDTHTFLWYVLANPNLSFNAKKIIDTRTGLYFSSVSLWEIAIKINIGKLELNCSFQDLLQRLSYLNIEVLSMTNQDIILYSFNSNT